MNAHEKTYVSDVITGLIQEAAAWKQKYYDLQSKSTEQNFDFIFVPEDYDIVLRDTGVEACKRDDGGNIKNTIPLHQYKTFNYGKLYNTSEFVANMKIPTVC